MAKLVRPVRRLPIRLYCPKHVYILASFKLPRERFRAIMRVSKLAAHPKRQVRSAIADIAHDSSYSFSCSYSYLSPICEVQCNMSLREATYADLVPASKVLAAAFKDEPLFGVFFHPHRADYPEDMSLYFLRKLRIDWATGPPDCRIVLSYDATAKSTTEQRITGVAVWERKRAVSQPSTWAAAAAVKAISSYNYLESLVYPNRAAADAERLSLLERSGPYIKHHWTGTRAESWYLDLIGVDPTQGGHGYGRQLVAWGRERAAEEGVGASLIAASGRDRFYQACGFDVIVGSAGDEGGEANQLGQIEGGTILFWDNGVKPEGIKKYGEA